MFPLFCNSSFGQTRPDKNIPDRVQPLLIDTLVAPMPRDTIPHLQLSRLRLINLVFVIEERYIPPRKPPELPEPKFEE